MNCKYCGSWNAEDDHRCSHCGRRVQARLVYPASRSAFALLLDEWPRAEASESSSLPVAPDPSLIRLQPSLNLLNAVPQKLGFELSAPAKIIPFESITGHRAESAVSTPAPAKLAPFLAAPAISAPHPLPRTETPKPAPRKRTAPPHADSQTELDFLLPAQGPRMLKTQVEAVIYCDAEVASAKHRAVAAALDGGMIFTGCALFLFTFHFMGGMFRLNRQTIPFFIAVLGTLALFYGMLWIFAGRETAGMRWAGLRLINFDGRPADRRARLLRALGGCLSLSAGAIGLLWALVDEERLAWHDHMSKTFPTLEESNTSFSRKR